MLNTQAGLDKEKYLMICEQMGQEPDPDAIPLSLSDMPHIVQVSHLVFNALPDRFIPLGMEGSRYGGKDLTGISELLKIYELNDTRDRQLALDIVLHLERKAVSRAASLSKKRK